jgi:hypothetical protein
MSDPIPVSAPLGRADWTDYVHNWREIDAEWIQDRSVLRFANAAARDGAITSPTPGQFVYLDDIDILTYRSKTGSWRTYKPLPQNTAAFSDTTTEVKIGHSASGSKGVIFGPGDIKVDQPFSVLNNTLNVDATGVNVKTGTAVAKLTTDATHLLSDKPLKISAVDLTSGTGTVIDATAKTVAVGTLTSTQVNTTNMSLSGTLSGGVLNGSSGTIGGVTLSGNYAQANSGYVANEGYFYGDSTGAIMRQRDAGTGTVSASYIQIQDAENIVIDGGTTWFRGAGRIDNPSLPLDQWLWVTPGADGWLGPVIYSASDPGAANYPNGTIWVS